MPMDVHLPTSDFPTSQDGSHAHAVGGAQPKLAAQYMSHGAYESGEGVGYVEQSAQHAVNAMTSYQTETPDGALPFVGEWGTVQESSVEAAPPQQKFAYVPQQTYMNATEQSSHQDNNATDYYQADAVPDTHYYNDSEAVSYRPTNAVADDVVQVNAQLAEQHHQQVTTVPTSEIETPGIPTPYVGTWGSLLSSTATSAIPDSTKTADSVFASARSSADHAHDPKVPPLRHQDSFFAQFQPGTSALSTPAPLKPTPREHEEHSNQLAAHLLSHSNEIHTSSPGTMKSWF
jgi:hypothetical protein